MSQVETNTLILAVVATALIVYITCTQSCDEKMGVFALMMNKGLVTLGLKKKIDPLPPVGAEGVVRGAGVVRPLINQGAPGAIQERGAVRSEITNKSTGAAPQPKGPKGSTPEPRGLPIRSEVGAEAPGTVYRSQYGSKTIGSTARAPPQMSLKDLVGQVTGRDATPNHGVGDIQPLSSHAGVPGPHGLHGRGAKYVAHKIASAKKTAGTSLSAAYIKPAPQHPQHPQHPQPQMDGAFNAAVKRPEMETSTNKNALLDIRGRPEVAPPTRTMVDALNNSSVMASDLF